MEIKKYYRWVISKKCKTGRKSRGGAAGVLWDDVTWKPLRRKHSSPWHNNLEPEHARPKCGSSNFASFRKEFKRHGWAPHKEVKNYDYKIIMLLKQMIFKQILCVVKYYCWNWKVFFMVRNTIIYETPKCCSRNKPMPPCQSLTCSLVTWQDEKDSNLRDAGVKVQCLKPLGYRPIF